MPSWLYNTWERATDLFSIGLTKKSSLIFILSFTAIAVIDSTIVNFSAYADAEFSMLSNLVIFTLFYLALGTISIIVLNSVKKNVLKSVQKLPVKMRHFHTIIFAVQILMMGIILTIILQMILMQKYDVRLLHSSAILTQVSALIFMIVLVIMFVSWLRSRRNYITILYLISFSLISVSIVLSLIYLEFQYSLSLSVYRKPYPIHSYVERQEIRPISELLGTIFDIVYLLSFFAIWIATTILLKQYRYKLGSIKYFMLISIPMIYYLFTFAGYFGNVFSQIVLHYPVSFGVTYTLIFSATKQIGALLFSLAFLTASSLVVNERVRKSLLISAIGIAMLFGSIEITTLQYRLYPPFGLVTEAFMPLGAYLLLVGIFTSATSVARDAKLRKEFYRTAISQFNLLKTIGITQMEKELLKEYKPVLARSTELSEPEYQPLEQSEVEQIIHDVLKEIQARKSKRSDS